MQCCWCRAASGHGVVRARLRVVCHVACSRCPLPFPFVALAVRCHSSACTSAAPRRAIHPVRHGDAICGDAICTHGDAISASHRRRRRRRCHRCLIGGAGCIRHPRWSECASGPTARLGSFHGHKRIHPARRAYLGASGCCSSPRRPHSATPGTPAPCKHDGRSRYLGRWTRPCHP